MTAAILLANNSIAIEHHCSQQVEKAKRAPGDTMKEKSRTDLEKTTTTNQPNKTKTKKKIKTRKVQNQLPRWGSCGFTRMKHAQVTETVITAFNLHMCFISLPVSPLPDIVNLSIQLAKEQLTLLDSI